MKKSSNKLVLVFLAMMLAGVAFAQQPALQYFRPNNQDGLNVFEPSKIDTVGFQGVKVRVGGDFALQFQSLNQSNANKNLVELGSDFNLPSANLNLDVQLLDGVRMHLRSYLSSRHHNDFYIKGGHLRVDNLNFIKPGFLEGVMKYASITVGYDEFNYGDAHFRRSDNARGLFNPFVENFIMDAFSTEPFGEIEVQKNGLLAIVGLTNGKLNQKVVVDSKSDNKPSFYGKVGFDKQLSDLRVRLTGSWYINHGLTTGAYLYGGDRAGARYYYVMHTVPDDAGKVEGADFEGRFNAKFAKQNAFQINPFIKFKGLELFGIYELADGSNTFTEPAADEEGSYTQMAGELVYRFGANDKFYLAGRYNTINGKALESATIDQKIERYNIGGGWFLSKNILAKIEYVRQQYTGKGWTGRFNDAEFNGVNFEAVIGF
ncbi:MAG TPA: hypothetical protein VFO54_08370 [Chryseosolibacter sp.]|nr:hypothetical protein [Chryseosolibacter sp.]